MANLRNYFGRFAPELLTTDYGRELWAVYETGLLRVDSKLTGYFEESEVPVDLEQMLAVIEDAKEDEAERRQRLQDRG